MSYMEESCHLGIMIIARHLKYKSKLDRERQRENERHKDRGTDKK